MKNTLYGIGLDIGVASVGWAVVGLNGTGEPVGLHRLGVRIFDKAEQPKTGESLAAPRRMARGMRRRLRRKALRRADVYALLERSGLSTREALAQMFEAGGLEDIYALRTRALDEPVGKAEFSRILLHLAQRRGFKSNRRTASDGEDGRLLAAVNENRRRMAQGGWRTVGEMLYRHEAFALHKRNKADDYLSTVGRDMVAEEASILFERQRAMGCSWATPELQAEYLSILLRQRSFDEGPGGNSPYGGNQVEKMVGRCTFEPDEPRAAKAAYSFEYFSLLQKLNHIRLAENGETRPLTQPQRQQLLSLAHKTPDMSLARIRKELALPETVQFNGVRCRANETLEESEKKEKFACARIPQNAQGAGRRCKGPYFLPEHFPTRRGRHRAFPLQKRGYAARKADGGRFPSTRDRRAGGPYGLFKIRPPFTEGLQKIDPASGAGADLRPGLQCRRVRFQGPRRR